jgi:FemAB-related protein (PEP-CTERM system-associated)
MTLSKPEARRVTEGEALQVVDFAGDGRQWDEYVAATPGSTFCHLAGWHRVMTDVLRHECCFRVALDSLGTWQGVLPLVRVRSRLFGHYLLSMPFLNYGGALGTPTAQRRLVESAVGSAERFGVDLLELRGRRPANGDLSISQRKITVLLELPSDPEVLWRENFPAKLRSQIRRPMKEGMETKFGLDQAAAFYEVFARNMRDLGTPVLPRRLFETFKEVFPNSVEFGAVYLQGEPVAGGCGFRWRDEFEMTWASSLREYRRMAPNMLLYWSFIERMADSKVRVFNFGRCTPGSGNHRFKSQWGGKDVPLPWAQWSPGSVDATPSPDRPLYRLTTAAWRRLPLAIAKRIGPLLARQLP